VLKCQTGLLYQLVLYISKEPAIIIKISEKIAINSRAQFFWSTQRISGE
jgi:hypothetical protein